MLLAVYPPWIVVGNVSSAGALNQIKTYGYASVLEPPDPSLLNGAVLEVDLPKLLLADAVAIIPIVGLWFLSGPFRREMEKAEAQENKYHGPEANQNLSRSIRAVLCLVTASCIIGAVCMLKDNVNLARAVPGASSALPH